VTHAAKAGKERLGLFFLSATNDNSTSVTTAHAQKLCSFRLGGCTGSIDENYFWPAGKTFWYNWAQNKYTIQGGIQYSVDLIDTKDQ
jgi:hypothetical protein